jgi:Tol biopolymer transport system component
MLAPGVRFVKLVDALFEGAWLRRGIRTRIAGLLALAVAVVAILVHTTSSPSTSSALAADSASAASSWIAFQRDSGVWIVTPDGSRMRLVARGGSGPVWSPDGRRIAFGRRDGSDAGVYVINIDGGEERRLTREQAGRTDGVMSWSPSGRMIAFYRQFSRPGTCGPLRLAGDFYVMNADGSGIRRLTRHGQAHYSAAVWSPDSRRIAIVSCHRSPRGDPEIYVIEADGSGERRLTRRPGWDVPEGWSHNGRTLLVGGEREGAADLYLISPDGHRRRNLTRSPEHEFGGAAWSPDQRRIVFVRVAGGGSIHVMNADGSRQRNMNAQTVPDTAPSWSPDGRRLVFSANLLPWQVHVMNADGTKRRNLTPGIWPVWSPSQR